MQLGVLVPQPGVLLFQPRDAFHRLKKLLFQLRNTLPQLPAVRAVAGFWQLHGAERYGCPAARTRSIRCRKNLDF
jgi:hypothetical protein